MAPYPRRFLVRVGRTPYRSHLLGNGSKCRHGKGLKTVCIAPRCTTICPLFKSRYFIPSDIFAPILPLMTNECIGFQKSSLYFVPTGNENMERSESGDRRNQEEAHVKPPSKRRCSMRLRPLASAVVWHGNRGLSSTQRIFIKGLRPKCQQNKREHQREELEQSHPHLSPSTLDAAISMYIDTITTLVVLPLDHTCNRV